MTIYFKSGETLHVSGREGERIMEKVAECVTKLEEARIVVIPNEDEIGKTDIILNLDEVAAMR